MGQRLDRPSVGEPGNDDVTRLLRASCDGDDTARDELLRAVHDELRGIARAHMRGERADHTLGATALVHEAYLRLVRSLMPGDRTAPVDWADRASFFAAATTAMRRILVDHARARASRKRGGTRSNRISLDVLEAARTSEPDSLLALDEALDRLASIDPRAAQIVRLRFFGGLEQQAIAALLGCTERTVKRDWSFARAWLHDALGCVQRSEPEDGAP